MMSGGVHDFELIRLLGGDFAYVFAAACPTALPDMRADDSSIALCELENGIAATVTESFSLHTPSPGVNGSVHGTRGGLWFQDGQIRLFAPVAGGDGDPVETLIRIPERNSFAVEVDHFLDCVLDGEACIASAERLRHTLASVLAAYESMRTNQRIEVAQFEAAGG
jgi:predicted dehydrogenase